MNKTPWMSPCHYVQNKNVHIFILFNKPIYEYGVHFMFPDLDFYIEYLFYNGNILSKHKSRDKWVVMYMTWIGVYVWVSEYLLGVYKSFFY